MAGFQISSVKKKENTNELPMENRFNFFQNSNKKTKQTNKLTENWAHPCKRYVLMHARDLEGVHACHVGGEMACDAQDARFEMRNTTRKQLKMMLNYTVRRVR